MSVSAYVDDFTARIYCGGCAITILRKQQIDTWHGIPEHDRRLPCACYQCFRELPEKEGSLGR